MREDFAQDLFLLDPTGIKDSPTFTVPKTTETESLDDSWSGYDVVLHDCAMMRTPEDIEWATREGIREDYLLFEYASSHWAAHFEPAFILGTPEL